MEHVILPAEIMCAVLMHLPDPWWFIAARVCRWWRACVEKAAEIRRLPMTHFLQQMRDGYTLGAAVRGGHVGVVTWMAHESGAPLGDATAAAAWMANSRARSWQEAAVDAARDGADVAVITWIARNAIGHTVPMIASVVYGRDDCIVAMLRDRKDTVAIPPRRRSKFPIGSPVTQSARVTACVIAAGRFGRDPYLDGRCAVGASTLFVAAVVGVPIGDLEHNITQGYNGGDMVSPARWLEAHRPPFGSPAAESRDPTARNFDGAWDQTPGRGAPTLESVTTPPWPRMRRLVPDDFLPGGALCAFCDLDMDRDASGEKYLVMLLRPLLVDPSDWQALRSCLPRSAKPVVERFKGKAGRVRGNCMR
ncbi:F-box incomplete domain containing protein [Pandoravirus macleodensis]|uniref:F-box incomplete domain containing protein n=1 Tax=Pandoravirus macleodensis TaxID=2107707 RepID=A0A2U7UFE6_9VIRU|nr:F-box incomplete domain containing protein [Pandoravirus macleodensis]AVK77177.1 F-box incomplete domain containing protein [Pandoravirus macleodensis]